MALTRLNEFDAGTTLTETEIEGEFDNIYANSLSLISPLTGNLAVGGFRLTGFGLGTVGDPSIQFTGDTNTGIYSTAADTVDISTGGVRAASFGATALVAAVPEDSRTATVDQAFEIRSTTSGSPAAGIGVGLLFSAESGDENPSDFGRIDFAATDVGAGTEDTYLSVLLRVAGRALDEKYRFSSTAGDGFAALFTHAVTADRTYTLPDRDLTFGAAPTIQVFTANDTWTKPAGLTAALVRVVGGGAAGGAYSAPNGGGGGGAGGYAEERLATAARGATETVTVGGGGAGGVGTGGNGVTSSFGALLSATGGTGAGAGNSAGGGGGAGVGGSFNATGGGGAGGGGTAGSQGFGGIGGASALGGGAAASASGSIGGNYGGGGSGGGSGSANGGSGAAGIVIVVEFY